MGVCRNIFLLSNFELEWIFPGVVVSVVVPFSVPVGNALQLLISDVIVCVVVGSWSIDFFLTKNSFVGSVHVNSSSQGYSSTDIPINLFM